MEICEKKKRYSVSVTIHEALNLVTRKGQPVDPLIVVRCCGREYRTDIKLGKANVVSWDESFCWTDILLLDEEWESAFIEFELQATNAFWRNDVIGVCAIQLKIIQARESHMLKKEIPLTDNDSTEIKGQLRLTVIVCNEEDVPPSPNDYLHEEEQEDLHEFANLKKAVIDGGEEKSARDSNKNVFHVYVSIHKVEDLAPCSKGLRDPFVTCEFGGFRLKSSQARSCVNHTFDECFRHPVITPVQEDTILIKLWDWNFMQPDELIAMGRISFSELRVHQLLPRWFNLYGFDKSEIGDIDELAKVSGGKYESNCYAGRMLISARAVRLRKEEDLLNAHTIAAHSMEEPPVFPMLLFADVYEVQGAVGNQISVDVWCGPFRKRTKWVNGSAYEDRMKNEPGNAILRVFEHAKGVADYIIGNTASESDVFLFNHEQGRIEGIRLVLPKDVKQQWDIIISVYARGLEKGLVGEVRIGYFRLKMSHVPFYVENYPSSPTWIPLRMMPNVTNIKNQAAVLICIEKAKNDNILRSRRKNVTFLEYELRSYIYAARNITSPTGAFPNPYVQISCLGTTACTSKYPGASNPVILECLKIQLRISADPVTKLPTAAPIVVDLYEERSYGIQFLGRATCHYDRLRGKMKANETLQVLKPQWIKLKSGKNWNKHSGDILLCFELVTKKDALSIPPQPMRPQVRLCTLNFSCFGLRNLILSQKGNAIDYLALLLGNSNAKSFKTIRKPIIHVSVASFANSGLTDNEFTLKYTPNTVNDNIVNKKWSGSWGENFDILMVHKKEIDIPIDPIYDPNLVIRVYDRKIKEKYFVGQTCVSLVPYIPWIQDVEAANQEIIAVDDLTDTLHHKMFGGVICGFLDMLIKGRNNANVGLSAIAEADNEIIRIQEKNTVNAGGVAQLDDASILENQRIQSDGLDKTLVKAYSIPNHTYYIILLNMFVLNVFIPSKFVVAAEGIKVSEKKIKETFSRPSVEGCLEEHLDDNLWQIESLKKMSQGKENLTGNIKMAISVSYRESESCNISRESIAITKSAKKLKLMYRGEKAFPKLIKLRVYIIRGISLAIENSKAMINPYISYSIGSKTKETLRSNLKLNTSNPEFNIEFERNIVFPEDTFLEISIWSASESVTSAVQDFLLGSTLIDLEERWFSQKWQKMMSKNRVNMEYRNIYLKPNGFSRGTLEMWIEMFDYTRESEFKKFDLKDSLPTEVEIRVIIWGVRNLSFSGLNKDSLDCMVRCTLDCTKYNGAHPIVQQTDTHYNTKSGNAIFHWRMVYPNIAIPVSSCILQLSAYDYKSLGQPLFLGEANLQLKRYIKNVSSTLSMFEADEEFKLINRSRNNGNLDSFGHVQITLQILAQSEANGDPVGLGRNEPNKNPRLTTPEDGRSWDDFLQAAGLKVDYKPLWFKIRLFIVFALSIIIFVLAFVYPALLLSF